VSFLQVPIQQRSFLALVSIAAGVDELSRVVVGQLVDRGE
jgi:hypothetical protein